MKKKSINFLIVLICCFSSMNAQTFTPTHKVVIEDQTICATSFGIWCPRSIVRIDSFAKSAFGNMAELISIHSSFYGPPNDSMENFAYWNGCFYNPHLRTNGWPQIMVDRKKVTDPDSIFFFYNQYSSDFGVADIAVNPVYNKSTRALDVTATAHFAVKVVHYNLALVLTEDSVHGTSINYSQRNIYSGGSHGAMSGGGINFVAQPDPVPASLMYYRHVAREILPMFQGKQGSLPDTMYADSTYHYTFPTYTVPAKYSASKMRAIVLLIDTVSGEIKNANGAFILNSNSGIPKVANGVTSFSIFPNPFSGETSLKITLSTTENISMQISNILGRIVSTYDMGLMTSGEHSQILNEKDMVPGVYFITLKTLHGSLTKKIVMSK